MEYAIGSLVQARGREWVVLPDSNDDFLLLRPLGGTDQEIAGLFLPLERDDVRPATFDPPDPQQVGDFRSSRLLRDAARLGFRSSAGPFRSAARIHVEPRPYQLVPLLMALKLEPVRLLIADDVGIGKTIEASLIARELLDRGEVKRLAVLCPPHLAEQWQEELAEKFHIQAELVLPSTVQRLERHTAVGQSLFELYPFVIVSTEYIKSTRRREEFVRTCPELVIVDEAHTCAFSPDRRGGRHLRHQLIQALAENKSRHMLLVTATPHSGDEGAFRSLLGLLRSDFLDLPQDLSGRANEKARREVAAHLVQRRRADIRDYMEQTTFPEREEAEESYQLSREYRQLLADVLDYARERVLDQSGSQHRQRVQWWSALALLRSLASSPAAAAATLRVRSTTADTATSEEADEVGARAVLDLDDVESGEWLDMAPGSLEGEEQSTNQRERLLRFARRATALQGPTSDLKLQKAILLVKKLLKEGFHPILFCRFIPTAEYVANELRQALPKGVEVACVTGTLPPAERESRVEQMRPHNQRVLVATDCLSEGINLQDLFNAVVHYDLSWNPTRHEQREGRTDRFGQPSAKVRAVTYYGIDNQIDGLVLDVLLRKHKAIRTSLGISVPLPANTGDVVQALLNGLLLRGSQTPLQQMALPFMSGMTVNELQLDWESVSQREKQSRTLFAQHTLNVRDVAQEWEAMRAAIGTHQDVERFMAEVVQTHGGAAARQNGHWVFTLPNKQALIEACGGQKEFQARFTLPVADNVLYLSRTHPFVEGLATYTMDTALDPLLEGVAKRAGVMRTRSVPKRTVLLLLRFRYHLIHRQGREETPLLAEECAVMAFRGRVPQLEWLSQEEAEPLLQAVPDSNIAPQQAADQVQRVLDDLTQARASLEQIVQDRSGAVLEAHQRVRAAAKQATSRYDVRPQLPPDILGVYVLLPVIQ